MRWGQANCVDLDANLVSLVWDVVRIGLACFRSRLLAARVVVDILYLVCTVAVLVCMYVCVLG